MNNDLISREALKKYARVVFDKDLGRLQVVDVSDIDNAPTVDIRNKGACEDCEYFDRPITSEPCRNCTLAYGSCFKEKEKVKDDRPQGGVEFAKWVTKMIFDNGVEDFDFELFSELACRKLEKMGLVEKTESEWKMKGGAE